MLPQFFTTYLAFLKVCRISFVVYSICSNGVESHTKRQGKEQCRENKTVKVPMKTQNRKVVETTVKENFFTEPSSQQRRA